MMKHRYIYGAILGTLFACIAVVRLLYGNGILR